MQLLFKRGHLLALGVEHAVELLKIHPLAVRLLDKLSIGAEQPLGFLVQAVNGVLRVYSGLVGLGLSSQG